MIPVFKPLIGEHEIRAATESLENGWLGMGSYVQEFEEKLGEYLDLEDKFVVAVSTGHAALHLGLLMAGVTHGDEVITPSFNNIADIQAILAVGARPVFCDVENDTLNIDLGKAEALISAKTKAIIPMDYDCVLCDHVRVKDISEKHGIRVMHDAAHSLGSKYRGAKIGSFSDICMFSFDPVKTITTIDGGALIVRTEKERDFLHESRLIGMGQPASLMYKNQRAWTYDVTRLGFRYHMANLHAAIGISQLNQIDGIVESRRNTCRIYNQELSVLKDITLPKTDFDDIAPFLYYIRVEPSVRTQLIEYLRINGVDTGIHWQPAHRFSLFEAEKKGDLSVTERVGDEVLSLPLHSHMANDDLNYVIATLKSFYL